MFFPFLLFLFLFDRKRWRQSHKQTEGYRRSPHIRHATVQHRSCHRLTSTKTQKSLMWTSFKLQMVHRNPSQGKKPNLAQTKIKRNLQNLNYKLSARASRHASHMQWNTAGRRHVYATCCAPYNPMPNPAATSCGQLATYIHASPTHCSLFSTFISRINIKYTTSFITPYVVSFFLLILSISFTFAKLITIYNQQAGLGPTLFARMQLVMGISFGRFRKHLVNPLPCSHFIRCCPFFPPLCVGLEKLLVLLLQLLPDCKTTNII